MTMEFTESVTLSMPKIGGQNTLLEESGATSKKRGLVVEIASIHEGMTDNKNFYSQDALRESLESWVSPYPKPIIKNHDLETEPIGRVIAAKLDEEPDGTPYVRLQVAITDEEAANKIMDGRYLTGSVGGKADRADCSICGENWAVPTESGRGLPCEHRKGRMYEEQLAFFKMSGITWREYSIVNAPADERSSIISKTTAQESDGWVTTRVFSIDMEQEKIVEYSEAGALDVLEHVAPETASAAYNHIKSAFLSAISAEEKTDNDKETDMAQKDTSTEEDILSVTEGLSDDLASLNEEEVEQPQADETTDSTDEPAASEDPAPSEDNDDSEGGDEDAPGDDAEEASDEEDADNEGDQEDEGEADASDDESPEEEPAGDDSAPEGEESDEATALALEMEELKQKNEALEADLAASKERNTKLEGALKRSLAERVVDTKISLGFAEADKRDAEIADHFKRSAGSLADSLRDLAQMSPVETVNNNSVNLPQEMETKLGAVDTPGSVVTEGEEAEEDKNLDPEQLFVDVLMGRRKL